MQASVDCNNVGVADAVVASPLELCWDDATDSWHGTITLPLCPAASVSIDVEFYIDVVGGVCKICLRSTCLGLGVGSEMCVDFAARSKCNNDPGATPISATFAGLDLTACTGCTSATGSITIQCIKKKDVCKTKSCMWTWDGYWYQTSAQQAANTCVSPCTCAQPTTPGTADGQVKSGACTGAAGCECVATDDVVAECCGTCCPEPCADHDYIDNPTLGCPVWTESGRVPLTLHATVVDCDVPCDFLIGLTFEMRALQLIVCPGTSATGWYGFGCRQSVECDPPLGCAPPGHNHTIAACMSCKVDPCGKVGYALGISPTVTVDPCADDIPPDACGERAGCAYDQSVQDAGGTCFPFYRRFVLPAAVICCCTGIAGTPSSITIEVTE